MIKLIKYVNLNCNVDENLSSFERRGDFVMLEDLICTQKDINTYLRIFKDASNNNINDDIPNGTNIYLHNIQYPRHILSSYQKNRLRDHGDIIKFVRKPNNANLIVLDNIEDCKLEFEQIYISKRFIEDVDDPLYFLGFDDETNRIPVYTLLKGIEVDSEGRILNYKKRSDKETIISVYRINSNESNIQNYLDILDIDSRSKFNINLMVREKLNNIISTVRKTLTYADVLNLEAMLTNNSHQEIATSNLLTFSTQVLSNKFWFEYLFIRHGSIIKNTAIYSSMNKKNIIPNSYYIKNIPTRLIYKTLDDLKNTLFTEIKNGPTTLPYDSNIISKIRVVENLYKEYIKSEMLMSVFEENDVRVSIHVDLESETYNIKPKKLYMNFDN